MPIWKARRRSRFRGFSVVEALVTFVILAVISSWVSLSINRADRSALLAEAIRIQSFIREVRLLALEQRRSIGLTYLPELKILRAGEFELSLAADTTLRVNSHEEFLVEINPTRSTDGATISISNRRDAMEIAIDWATSRSSIMP